MKTPEHTLLGTRVGREQPTNLQRSGRRTRFMKLRRWQRIHHVEKDGTYWDSHCRTEAHVSLTSADAYELHGLSWLVQYRQRWLLSHISIGACVCVCVVVGMQRSLLVHTKPNESCQHVSLLEYTKINDSYQHVSLLEYTKINAVVVSTTTWYTQYTDDPGYTHVYGFQTGNYHKCDHMPSIWVVYMHSET